MKKRLIISFILAIALAFSPQVVLAEQDEDATSSASMDIHAKTGGGYAITGQVPTVGYSAKLYDATNGLPTSDANVVMADKEGYIWIGGYAGVIKYDGTTFERFDSSEGITSGKAIYEDSKGRIWIGTNDNGVIVLDGDSQQHFTYKDGLPSSTIRSFVEGDYGRIYIATTNGVCYMDDNMKVHVLDDDRFDNAYVLRLWDDGNGMVYGNTRNGEIFRLKNGSVAAFDDGEALGFGKVGAIYPSKTEADFVYIGNDNGELFYGKYGDNASAFTRIDVSPAKNINWISEACGCIWITAENVVGYVDENNRFNALDNLPVDSGIEMVSEDYQGNIWLASTRKGVAKIVTNNFQNLFEKARARADVVNTTCLYGGDLYVGMDTGLQIIDHNYQLKTNELTEYLEDTRIRCMTRDSRGFLWVSTYNNNRGLVRYSLQSGIRSYTTEDGMPSNSVRCTTLTSDGEIVAGTNTGVAIIRNDEIWRVYEAEDGLDNAVCLTITEGPQGELLMGSDGGGMYLIDNDKVRHFGRDEGLSSDVILRVKWDDERGVYWLITSNAIQYMKDNVIYDVKNFPYSNNFDIYFDNSGNAWVLSSYGVYCLKAQDMLDKAEYDYKLYNCDSGLSSTVTGNSFSELDTEGNLFICERSAVDKVNINDFFIQVSEVRIGLKNITCNDEVLTPNQEGKYVIPANAGRIQMNPLILNYTLTNPLIRVYLEGDDDEGIMQYQSNLTALEYTGLKYGDYVLHVQILDESSHEIYQDETCNVEKRPRIGELAVIRAIMIFMAILLGAFMVWRIMSNTIIRRQYKEIASAKDEAERANSAKSRFLANMSHEIRTPINTILGMDEMIIREDATGVPKPYFMSMMNYAYDIKGATESLLGLINDILDISKIESGKMHLVEQEYAPVEEIRNLIKMIRVRSNEKNLNFDVDIDENIPSRLYGDKGKIKQVVLNLLTNAVKYTKEGGFRLSVDVAEINGSNCKLVFIVKDTGIGIKQENLDRLFSAFERFDEEKNSEIQGTGLGLDISKQFAELMNGELACESVYGQGSTFTLVVSQKIIDATPIGEFSEEVDEAPKGQYMPQFIAPDASILVVDDNPMNLTVIKGLLTATKVFVSTASSGMECLEKLKEGSFNVVFLDHLMPGMDGIETVGKIREKYPDLPVYALTANTEPEGSDFYESKGFNGYLSKPIDSETLEMTIKRHIPEDIMMDMTEANEQAKKSELPENMAWLNSIDSISVEDGIKNTGGADFFLFSLRMFKDTIDDNSVTLIDALDEGDIELYTVKVHALKSSARIIGEHTLSKMAEELEAAGKAKNIDFINDNNPKLIQRYRSYKEKLSRLDEENA